MSPAPRKERATTAARWKYTYTKQRVLGKGAFAVVYPGTRRRGSESEPIAVKVCDPACGVGKKRPIQLEIEILKELRSHPNIVTLHTAFVDTGLVHMCFERCDEDLEDYVRARPPPMDEAEIRVAGRQIAAAVEYLHAQDIMHRDLKPRNILLVVTDDKDARPFNRVVKVSDLGMARRGTGPLGRDDSHGPKSAPIGMSRAAVGGGIDQTWCGSPLYMSPEMLYRLQYDKAVDIYAVGVILYYMRSRCTPVRGKTLDELRVKLPQAKPVWPDKTSSDLKDLCASAMDHDPEQRPSRLSIHPFFRHRPSPLAAAGPPALDGSLTDGYVVVDNGNDLSNRTALQHSLLMDAKSRALTEADDEALRWAMSGMAAGPVPPGSPSHPERVRRLVDPERYERSSMAAAARGDVEVARAMAVLAEAGRGLCLVPPPLPKTPTLAAAEASAAESNYLGTQADSATPIAIEAAPAGTARFCYNCGNPFRCNTALRCRCGYPRHQTMSV